MFEKKTQSFLIQVDSLFEIHSVLVVAISLLKNLFNFYKNFGFSNQILYFIFIPWQQKTASTNLKDNGRMPETCKKAGRLANKQQHTQTNKHGENLKTCEKCN